MNKIIFEKIYTRDNCFIIQEIWDNAYLNDFFENQNPFFPPQINYLNDGVVEIWENKKAIQWFMDQLLKKNIQDNKFLNSVIKKHGVILQKLSQIKNQRHLSTIAELKNLINLIKLGTYTFVAFYHSALDDRTPKKIRAEAIKTRKEDTFYDNMDSLIKNTIEYLYPHTKGLSISILSNELQSPPNEKILKQRFKNCIMIINKKPKITKIENFANVNPKYKFIFPKIIDSNFLKGQAASPGQATGNVRIIKRKNQISTLLPGEILVSPMTTPDFIPAMKKAAAIITDEGGITCHAAIVSRELKKPCIIGTKFATQILKDGNYVEVNATNGIIKIKRADE